MYELVGDVESYPHFLPWCGGAAVEVQPDGSLLARVDIAFKGLRQSFTTRNRHEADRRIDMQLHEGPFKNLQGHWQFRPLTDQACKVEFELEYHFSNGLLEKLVGPVFDHIAKTFVDAFVVRAEALSKREDAEGGPSSVPNAYEP
jgi:ribosome-associated toxin RatA of RatAB toxin-antitoxin module